MNDSRSDARNAQFLTHMNVMKVLRKNEAAMFVLFLFFSAALALILWKGIYIWNEFQNHGNESNSYEYQRDIFIFLIAYTWVVFIGSVVLIFANVFYFK